jgi:diguanylate cyclase (GGDEF)-like protein
MSSRLRPSSPSGQPGPVEGPASVARVLASLFLFGGLLLLASLLFPGSADRDTDAMAVVATVSLLAGLLYLSLFERAPSWLLLMGPALAVALIALAVYFAGAGASAAYAFALAAVVVASAACFPIGIVVTHSIVALIAYGAALEAIDGPADLIALHLLVAAGTMACAGIVVSNLSSQLRSLTQRLADAARTDPLTGLLNRRALDEGFETELARSRRTRSAVSLVVLDIDHFQRFNDERGHQAGDQILSRLAVVLRDTTRTVDLTARVGGEEFAVMAPETGIPGGLALAERLRRAIELEFSGESPTLTVSLGVSGSPGNGGDRQGLIKAASAALVEAKQGGRNKAAVSAAKPERLEVDRRTGSPVAS